MNKSMKKCSKSLVMLEKQMIEAWGIQDFKFCVFHYMQILTNIKQILNYWFTWWSVQE